MAMPYYSPVPAALNQNQLQSKLRGPFAKPLEDAQGTSNSPDTSSINMLSGFGGGVAPSNIGVFNPTNVGAALNATGATGGETPASILTGPKAIRSAKFRGAAKPLGPQIINGKMPTTSAEEVGGSPDQTGWNSLEAGKFQGQLKDMLDSAQMNMSPTMNFGFASKKAPLMAEGWGSKIAPQLAQVLSGTYTAAGAQTNAGETAESAQEHYRAFAKDLTAKQALIPSEIQKNIATSHYLNDIKGQMGGANADAVTQRQIALETMKENAKNSRDINLAYAKHMTENPGSPISRPQFEALYTGTGYKEPDIPATKGSWLRGFMGIGKPATPVIKGGIRSINE
jgi:hypothetical protein